MMKFIRGRTSSSGSGNRDSIGNSETQQLQHTSSNCGLTYDSKLNLLTIGTRNGLIKINCNSFNPGACLLSKLNSNSCFRNDASLNSSCNDSVISCSNSTMSSCNSCGERSSISELELSLASDCEEKCQCGASLQQQLMPWDFVDMSFECTGRARSSQHVVKVYTRILCADVEYKSLSITKETTSKKVICILLNKFKMKHRDPNLFYLTMEICIKKAGIPIRNVMVLNDESCPAQLKACYPHEETRFLLMMKYGGLVKVYDSCLMSGSLYKSILLSDITTVSELIQLMLHCYNSKDKVENYALFVVSKAGALRLRPDEVPIKIQSEWDDKENHFFQLRRIKELKMVSSPNKKYAINRTVSLGETGISCQEFQNYFYI